MLSSQRERAILQLLQETGSARIEALAARLGVTDETIRRNLKPGIPVIELDHNINDAEFADRCAALMLEMLRK